MIGTKVAHYEILAVLGRGGMGEVYRARDERLGRELALKFLPRQLSATSSAVARFMSEARAASVLDHRNICTIYDIGSSHDGQLFIAMAYYEGRTLDAMIEEGPFRPDQALDIARQVAEGLSAAHDKGIVHRDVKPSNVLITSEGIAKLLDFGIAKVAAIDMTNVGTTIGTAAYMSPEQARGDHVDHRTDVFSLGVVLYEMLTGSRPFRGEYEQAVLYSILNEAPQPIPDDLPDLPAHVTSLIEGMLEKNPEQRVKSMPEVVAALDGEELRVSAAVSGAETDEKGSKRPPTVVSERRRVTVLYGDIAAKMSLSRGLDPEDFDELVSAVRDRCAKVVHRFEGQFVPAGGTGFFAYFGYPKVFEDNVARAVRSGLGLVEAVDRMTLPEGGGPRGLQLKLGIHSGLVVTRSTESPDTSAALVGAPPEIARWVQRVSEPGKLFVTETVHRSVVGAFESREMGSFSPEDGAPSLSLFHVERERVAPVGRSGDDVSAGSPLLGRDREMDLFADHWERVCDGEGEVVLLGGEAGIGKSRLTRSIKEMVTSSGSSWLVQCQCSPYYDNTALYPIIQILEEDILDFHQDDEPSVRLEKIEGFLVQQGFSLEDNLPLLATLLSVAFEAMYEAPAFTPEKQKALTIQLLVNILLNGAQTRPVLFVVEDLHWADPTTLAFLDQIVDQGPTAPVLSLFTYRPDFEATWTNRSHVSTVNLRRLKKGQVVEIVSELAGGIELPAVVLNEIVAKTDGIPLFVEELTKSVLESDVLRLVEGRYELSDAAFSRLQIPDTLQDSLMARLDRLGEVRHVVQLASTIGRECNSRLLSAIVDLPREQYEESVSASVRAEFLYQRGMFPDATLIFKHALIRDAAYDSLVKKERQAAHRRIAAAIESHMPERAQSEPEVLAYHSTRGNMPENAIPLWLAAGQRDFARSANAEAQAHLNQGLHLLSGLPEAPERDGLEIPLQLILGFSLIATQGYASPMVEKALGRARELCVSLGNPPPLFPVLWGLWAYYIVRTDFPNAVEVTNELLAIAVDSGDSGQMLQSHTCSGMNHFWTGDLATARTYFETALSIYDPRQHISQAADYLQNPAVVCHSHLAWTLWMLGDPDRAAFHAERSIDYAREIGHPYSLGYALSFGAVYHQMCGDEAGAMRLATQSLELSTEQGFPIWQADADMILGWARARDGNADGLRQLQNGLDLWDALGARLWRTHQLALKAEIVGLEGRPDEGLAVIEEALSLMKFNDESYYAAELHRLKAELLAASGGATREDVFDEIGQSLRIANKKDQRGWRLRTLMSLCRFQERYGKPIAALDQLEETMASYDAGATTPDLTRARHLVADLS